MTFAGISHWGVIVAPVAGWLASAAWYMSLGKVWTAALGKTPEQMHAERNKPGAVGEGRPMENGLQDGWNEGLVPKGADSKLRSATRDGEALS